MVASEVKPSGHLFVQGEERTLQRVAYEVVEPV
jgi:hypothetical protein